MSTQPARQATPGAGPDVKTFGSAALLTFGAGMLGMVGWGLLSSGFGFFLGLVAAGFGIYWWKSLHGRVFPQPVPTRSVVILLVLDVVLMGILLLIAL
ncbi:hypothetical protein [Amycolatopsis jejuensis]|uniref:hypothetical protein n=1 Tax=Amycolatopsis jejuensis TaxID=330084 RepID=UPI00052647FE|nr:hypothetical protein [Amycolatopsis jejuensis]